MKEGEIIQWVFLFLFKQNLYSSFGGREKKRKKEQNICAFQKCLDVSALIYCNLEGRLETFSSHWGVLNGIAVEYCFISTQESDVHYHWLRDAASP